MREYHKIQSVYFRDPENNNRTFLEGQWSLPEFEYLKNNIWTFTEKVDGTNIRVMWNGESVHYGGKTDNAQIPTFLLDSLQNKFDKITTRKLLKETFEGDDICLYGEGYGAKINRGESYIKDGVDFVLFDAKIGDLWLERSNVGDIAKKFNLDVVPIIGEGTLTEGIDLVKDGYESKWGDFKAEGLVMRPKTELRTRRNHRIITKVKYKDFH